MKGLLLQDFITISTPTPTSTITQSETAWVDLAGYRDVILWLDTREQSGSLSLVYQTAPAKDDSLFATITTLMPSPGITLTSVLQDVASVPVARWLRWQIGGAVGDMTFRIWVAANRPGRRTLSRQ